MAFERHVFISYAHLDNQALMPGENDQKKNGWVTLLHGTLQTMLSQRMGRKADIWRDDRLRDNEVFWEEIFAQFPKTATLVSVLTPRYVESESCLTEIDRFCRAAEGTGGVLVGNKSRIFKVIKTPIQKDDSLPAIVKQMLGYEFFEYDDGETPRELDPVYGDKARADFLRKVNKLAWDIAQLIPHLGPGAPAGDGRAKTDIKSSVYLAECGRDQREAREILEAELQRHGYSILPDRRLPSEEEDYVAAVEHMLEQCRFSIHLVGGSYGVVPDGPSQRSVVVLQNDLAARRSKAGALQRVIWLPEGIRSEQPLQQAFIEALHERADLQLGADLITGNLEELKGAIHAALNKLERSTGSEHPEAEGKLVYVLCTEKDRLETVPLQKRLKACGLEVKLPVFTGDATEVREANQQLLTGCDAVILFYGAGDEAWKYHQQNELKKIRGVRRERPLLASPTYLARPATDDKALLLALEEPDLINGLEGFAESALEAFCRVVAAGSGP